MTQRFVAMLGCGSCHVRGCHESCSYALPVAIRADRLITGCQRAHGSGGVFVFDDGHGWLLSMDRRHSNPGYSITHKGRLRAYPGGLWKEYAAILRSAFCVSSC